MAMEGSYSYSTLEQCSPSEPMYDPQCIDLEGVIQQVPAGTHRVEGERTKIPPWNLARRRAVEAATSEALQARTSMLFDVPLWCECRYDVS